MAEPSVAPLNDARRHAVTASELLANLDHLADRLEQLTPDEDMQMRVTGGFKRVNADQHWTATLAIAHALTAIALTLGEGNE